MDIDFFYPDEEYPEENYAIPIEKSNAIHVCETSKDSSRVVK